MPKTSAHVENTRGRSWWPFIIAFNHIFLEKLVHGLNRNSRANSNTPSTISSISANLMTFRSWSHQHGRIMVAPSSVAPSLFCFGERSAWAFGKYHLWMEGVHGSNRISATVVQSVCASVSDLHHPPPNKNRSWKKFRAPLAIPRTINDLQLIIGNVYNQSFEKAILLHLH